MKFTSQFFSTVLILFLAAQAAAQWRCGPFDEVNNADYKIQNNIWNGLPGQMQCIEPTGSNAFVVRTSQHSRTYPGAPSAYPLVWQGCHYQSCTSFQDKVGLPIRVAEIGSARFELNVTRSLGGTWNVAPEAWFQRNQGPYDQPDGLEMMWWLDDNGPVDAYNTVPGWPRRNVLIDGTHWDVYLANQAGWRFMTFKRRQKVTSANIDMKAFMGYAIAMNELQYDWNLVTMQAGFEIWSGGAGLAVNNFKFEARPGEFGSQDGYFQLKARHSGKCLDVAGYSRQDGGRIHQWDCHGGDNQKFKLEPVGDGWFKIRGKQSGKCLDVSGVSFNNGALIHQWNCSGPNPNRQFKFVRVNDNSGFYQIKARHSGKCIDVAGISQNLGADIHQWGCFNSQVPSQALNQQFEFHLQ